MRTSGAGSVTGFACAFHSTPVSLQCSHGPTHSCCPLDCWCYVSFDRPTTGMGPYWTLRSIHVYQVPQCTGKHLSPNSWTKGFRQSNASMISKHGWRRRFELFLLRCLTHIGRLRKQSQSVTLSLAPEDSGE